MAYRYDDAKSNQKYDLETDVPGKMSDQSKCSKCNGTGEIEEVVDGVKVKKTCFCQKIKKLFRK